MSNNGVNTFVKSDFTFYKKKLRGKVMKTDILGYLNGNSSYIYVVTYVHECNFNICILPHLCNVLCKVIILEATATNSVSFY